MPALLVNHVRRKQNAALQDKLLSFPCHNSWPFYYMLRNIDTFLLFFLIIQKKNILTTNGSLFGIQGDVSIIDYLKHPLSLMQMEVATLVIWLT